MAIESLCEQKPEDGGGRAEHRYLRPPYLWDSWAAVLGPPHTGTFKA